MEHHIFFDLDRTLWDFNQNSKCALEILFKKYIKTTHEIKFESFYKCYVKINEALWDKYRNNQIEKSDLRINRFRDTFLEFGIDDAILSNQFSDGYVELSPYQTILFPNVIFTLKELKRLNYKMHIITNGFEEVQYIKLKNSGLIGFFDTVVCSEEINSQKPSPKIFSHALKKANAELNKSIMIGDDYEADILGGEKSGFKVLHFVPDEANQLKHPNNFKDFSELILKINEIFN